MSITIEQQPDVGIYASGGQHIYIASSDESNRLQHTITCKIYKGDTLVTTLKKPLNAQSAAVFDVGSIYNSQFEVLEFGENWFDTSSITWQANLITQNTLTDVFHVSFNEEWLEGGAVEERNDSDVDSSTIRLIYGGVDYYDERTKLSSSVDGPAMLTWGYGDKVEINDTQYLFVMCYGDDFSVNVRDTQSNTNHDILPKAFTQNAGLYLVRCDYAQIVDNFTPRNYTVRLEDTDNNLVDSVEVEAIEDKEIDNTTKFRWYNRGWREFDFTRDHSESTSVENRMYSHSTIDYNSDSYSKILSSTYLHPGRTKYHSRFDTTYTVTSRWMNGDTMDYVNTIYDSHDVWVLNEDDNWVPVVITSSMFEGYRTNRVTELQNRTLQYKLSVDKQLR